MAALAAALLLKGIYDAEVSRDLSRSLHRERSRDIMPTVSPPVDSGDGFGGGAPCQTCKARGNVPA